MSEKENVIEAAAAPVEPVVEPVVEAPKPVAEVKPTKPVEAKAVPTAIVLPEEEGEGPGLAPVANGTIGSTTVKAKKKVEPVVKVDKEEELVAVFSQKNLHWVENGGALKKGYNIVKKARADKWITLDGVRLATPEEVASAFDAGN